MLYKTISEVPDSEKTLEYYTSQFFIITNLAFLRYIKVFPSKESIDCHNSQIDFLELDNKLKIDFETMKYNMELENKNGY